MLTDIAVQLVVKEKHEIEMQKSFIPGWGRFGYFVSWKKPVTEGPHAGSCHTHINLESYRAEPPGPQLRYVTESGHHIGIFRIIKDEEKWYIEIMAEDPPMPERLVE